MEIKKSSSFYDLPEPGVPAVEPEHVSLSVHEGVVTAMLDAAGFAWILRDLWTLPRLSDGEDVSLYSCGERELTDGVRFGYCEIHVIPNEGVGVRARTYGGNRRIQLEFDRVDFYVTRDEAVTAYRRLMALDFAREARRGKRINIFDGMRIICRQDSE